MPDPIGKCLVFELIVAAVYPGNNILVDQPAQSVLRCGGIRQIPVEIEPADIFITDVY